MDPLARPTEQQPTEGTNVPATEEYQQLNQRLTERMLDKAASDPLWKQWPLTAPEADMRKANFPEYQGLEEVRQKEAEVRGHINLLPYDASQAL
jgi:hypothetical protein